VLPNKELRRTRGSEGTKRFPKYLLKVCLFSIAWGFPTYAGEISVLVSGKQTVIDWRIYPFTNEGGCGQVHTYVRRQTSKAQGVRVGPRYPHKIDCLFTGRTRRTRLREVLLSSETSGHVPRPAAGPMGAWATLEGGGACGAGIRCTSRTGGRIGPDLTSCWHGYLVLLFFFCRGRSRQCQVYPKSEACDSQGFMQNPYPGGVAVQYNLPGPRFPVAGPICAQFCRTRRDAPLGRPPPPGDILCMKLSPLASHRYTFHAGDWLLFGLAGYHGSD
jgi:hypothetical protein